MLCEPGTLEGCIDRSPKFAPNALQVKHVRPCSGLGQLKSFPHHNFVLRALAPGVLVDTSQGGPLVGVVEGDKAVRPSGTVYPSPFHIWWEMHVWWYWTGRPRRSGCTCVGSGWFVVQNHGW